MNYCSQFVSIGILISAVFWFARFRFIPSTKAPLTDQLYNTVNSNMPSTSSGYLFHVRIFNYEQKHGEGSWRKRIQRIHYTVMITGAIFTCFATYSLYVNIPSLQEWIRQTFLLTLIPYIAGTIYLNIVGDTLKGSNYFSSESTIAILLFLLFGFLSLWSLLFTSLLLFGFPIWIGTFTFTMIFILLTWLMLIITIWIALR